MDHRDCQALLHSETVVATGYTTDHLAILVDWIVANCVGISRLVNLNCHEGVGKPGLDGHSNGAEQIAVRARDCGMDVVYEGIRLTPSQIVRAAIDEGVHVVGLSILSGSLVSLVKDVIAKLDEQGAAGPPIVVGGIVPDEDASTLKEMGVVAVYTPKDFQLNDIMSDIVRLADAGAEAA